MWRLTVGAICVLIVLGSIPGNLTIIHYLNEKPPGYQTTVDSVFKDFFLINFTSILFNGLSIISLCYFGKLTEIIAICIAWTCLYFNLLSFTSGIMATFYRYLFIFRANQLLDMDDLFLVLFLRTTVTLPPTLILANLYSQEKTLPFVKVLTSFSRNEEPNIMDEVKAILAGIAFASGLICSVLACLKEKGSLQALQATRRSINLMPKNGQQRTVKNQDEYEQALHTLYKTLGQILALTIILALIIIFADYPTEMDFATAAFIFGLLFQGCVGPFWFILVRPEIFNFALRRIKRMWPFCNYAHRLKTSWSRA